MKIKISDFGKRHFDKNFGGTKVLDFTPQDFEEKINNDELIKETFIISESKENIPIHIGQGDVKLIPGYAPFCKLLAIRNFTDAKVGSLPITLENYQYLRSGYSSRRDSELPVISRWFELPLGKPKAEYLVLVLYSKEQIDKEAMVEYEKKIDNGLMEFDEQFVEFDAEYGIVAILGQSHQEEEPMKPETMLRNALGIKEGGSGVPLDRDKYLKSVKFWSNNATVK